MLLALRLLNLQFNFVQFSFVGLAHIPRQLDDVSLVRHLQVFDRLLAALVNLNDALLDLPDSLLCVLQLVEALLELLDFGFQGLDFSLPVFNFLLHVFCELFLFQSSTFLSGFQDFFVCKFCFF